MPWGPQKKAAPPDPVVARRVPRSCWHPPLVCHPPLPLHGAAGVWAHCLPPSHCPHPPDSHRSGGLRALRGCSAQGRTPTPHCSGLSCLGGADSGACVLHYRCGRSRGCSMRPSSHLGSVNTPPPPPQGTPHRSTERPARRCLVSPGGLHTAPRQTPEYPRLSFRLESTGGLVSP